MKFTRCWTGRRWVEFGPLAIGFGPRAFIERIVWRTRYLYVWGYPAAYRRECNRRGGWAA